LKRPSSGQRIRPATSRSRSSWADNHDRRSFVFGKARAAGASSPRPGGSRGLAVGSSARIRGGRLASRAQFRDPVLLAAEELLDLEVEPGRRAHRLEQAARPRPPSRPFSPAMFGSERARGASPTPSLRGGRARSVRPCRRMTSTASAATAAIPND
jgi:hypothetical protein